MVESRARLRSDRPTDTSADQGDSPVEQGVNTRDRILFAAMAQFAERGVEATSLDAVSAAVGVRKQTLLYWFPNKTELVLGVVDHAVAELGRRLTAAALASRDRSRRRRLVAVVDAVFRLGTTNPELLAVVREVARMGPPASTRVASAVDPLVTTASAALAGEGADEREQERIRQVLLAAGAKVVGIVTEAEIREDLGLPADLPWLRSRRAELLDSLGRSLE